MPTLTVIAGQNGSGKSTLVQAHQLVTIDPDRIAQSYGQGFTDAANSQAAREALRLQAQALSYRESFGIETTLAARQPIRRMQEARELGYQVTLAFVIPSNDNTRLRIDNRVNEGGHNIPDADLERRRPRVLENLPLAMQQAHMTAFYLSNTETRDFRLVGAAEGDEVFLTPGIPAHIRQVLERHFPVVEVPAIDQKHPVYGAFLGHVRPSG